MQLYVKILINSKEWQRRCWLFGRTEEGGGFRTCIEIHEICYALLDFAAIIRNPQDASRIDIFLSPKWVVPNKGYLRIHIFTLPHILWHLEYARWSIGNNIILSIWNGVYYPYLKFIHKINFISRFVQLPYISAFYV